MHVPFCAVRCGYCDFNTYTLTELGPGASTSTFVDSALVELDVAARVLGAGRRAGRHGLRRRWHAHAAAGGRPRAVRRPASGSRFGLAPDAEVTTEANPDSVTAADLEVLAAGGFTRVSVGMQSVVPHVLATLERTHDPARVATAVAGAKAAGLATSVDLIYGTPGESLADWRASLDAAVALEPDHVSAYALVVEEGTKLAAQVRRGEVPMPEGDDEADKYELADCRSRTGRLRLVRGEQLVARRARPVPAQRGLLARRRLVGRRAGRAQPRRRGALVEREAPEHVRRAAGRRVRRRRPGARP